MKQEAKDYECPYCHNHFYVKRGWLSDHMRYCNDNPNATSNKLLLSEKQKAYSQKQRDLEKETEREYTFLCKECGKEYNIILSDKQYNQHKYSNFCSISCARKNAAKCASNELKEAKCIDCGKTIYIKNKASDKICRCDECKDKYDYNKISTKQCIVCGKLFKRRNAKCCCKECSEIYLSNRKKYLSDKTLERFREIGKKSASKQSEIRRSKNEMEFCTICENYFTNVEHNKPIFNGWDADVIIHDIKYAILWNGKCHYEPIFGNKNFNKVQNRDKIKLDEIKKFGYNVYIIKDLGAENTLFVQQEFKKFLEYINS